MIREIAVILIYIIWVMCFHLSNVRRIEALKIEIGALEIKIEVLESIIDELERTVYIVPREQKNG